MASNPILPACWAGGGRLHEQQKETKPSIVTSAEKRLNPDCPETTRAAQAAPERADCWPGFRLDAASQPKRAPPPYATQTPPTARMQKLYGPIESVATF